MPEGPPHQAPDSARTKLFLVLAQLLVPGAVFVLGAYLKRPQSTWLIAAAIVATAVIASTATASLLGRYFAQRTERTIAAAEAALSQRLADVGQAALIRAEGRDGLTQEKLSEYESRIDIETVWIVGANFDNEITADAPFLKVVERNIRERGIKYVYIAPSETTESQYSLNRLRGELELDIDDPRLITLFLREDEWRQLPYTAGNFTIYDPVRKGHSAEGFFWDPGGDGKSFIALRREVVAQWVGAIQKIIPDLRDEHYGEKREDAPIKVSRKSEIPLLPNGGSPSS